MRSKKKIAFVDYSSGYVPEEQLLYKLISKHYDIDGTGKPDYIISCGNGRDHLQYPDVIKILWTGENMVPDFNFFDYAIGFDHLSFGDRYIRVPLYHFYFGEDGGKLNRELKSSTELLNRKFCSFVVSASGGNPLRRQFFEELSKYKKVDSGGGWLNNIGGAVADKHTFISGYKFNISFENSSSPGYTTEKLPQAFAAQTLPIYFGNPTVETDFNPSSFIRLRDENDVQRAIKEVIRLDTDDGAYLKMIHESCYDRIEYERRMNNLEQFLCHIFEQPIATARRRNVYGWQAVQCRRISIVLIAYDKARKAFWFCWNLLHGRI